MFSLTLIMIFLIIVAATWFMGVWSSMLTLINVMLAATIASGFFEVIATQLDNSVHPDTNARFAGRLSQHTYFLDFICLWGLFFISFGLLRLTTDILTRHRVKFDFWTEIVGRSVLSIWIAWTFICFASFTMHTAPMPTNAFNGDFQSKPETRNFLGIGPDRLWLAYLQSRSQGALSSWQVRESALHVDDRDKNVQVFDSKAEYIFKYNRRREVFAEQEAELVARQW